MPPYRSTPMPPRTGDVFARMAAWSSVSTSAVQASKWLVEKYQANRTYTVAVSSEDSGYLAVLDWVRGLLPEQRQRALVVATDRSRHYELPGTDDEIGAAAPRIRVAYDDKTEQRVTVDGHRVRVWIERAEGPESVVSRGSRPDRVRFRAYTVAGQRAVTHRVAEVMEAHRRGDRQPKLWMLDRYASWARRSDIPLRTADSVVLRAGQLDRITSDLGRFLDREQDYLDRGIPWRRGYHLWGPPGTGKTSVAKALAHQHKLDLWVAPLGDVDKDCSLLTLVGEIRQRGVLLLEDLDKYHAATEGQDGNGMVSTAGLLNALDGVTTPHGLITIITSNNPAVLQHALTRPGRISLTEHLGHVDQDQAEHLFRFFYERAPLLPWTVDDTTTPAELTELFTLHLDDPDQAEKELVDRYSPDQRDAGTVTAAL